MCRYAYDDVEVDFSRVVPVIATSVLLTVAGVSAWRADPQMGVLAAGPLVSTLLQVSVLAFCQLCPSEGTFKAG